MRKNSTRGWLVLENLAINFEEGKTTNGDLGILVAPCTPSGKTVKELLAELLSGEVAGKRRFAASLSEVDH